MTLAELDSELRSGKLRSVYLCYGPERSLILSAVDLIRQTLDVALQADRFTAGIHPAHRILETLKTPNLLSPKRLVIVEEIDDLKKEEWSLLKTYAEQPTPDVTLVLTGASAKEKSWPKEVFVLECKTLYPREVPSWINMEARRLGIKISFEAAHLLAEQVGSDLGVLHQALEKLTLFAGKTNLITPETVKKVVAGSREESVFDLTRALGEKNLRKVAVSLQNLLEQGEPGVRVLGMVARHLRLLSKTQDYLKEGCSDRELAARLKVHPFFVKEYVQQSKQWSHAEWGRHFRRLSRCDRKLKSSRIKTHLILEKELLSLCKS